jgi:nicotinate phosphoribosyltransferase
MTTPSPVPHAAAPRGGDRGPVGASTALLTDRYELTMLDAALRDGTGDRPTVFEVFTRRLPRGRRFGVVAGTGRLLELIARFRFGDAELAPLDDGHVVSPATLAHLAAYRFRGDIDVYPDGEVFVPGSPIVTVRASFADAVLLETLVLSVLNHDSAIAAAAARMVLAAEGRGLFEFGARRTHEEAAVAAARAAYVVGFDGTSNLAAGARYGIPTMGTSAHAFTLVHDDERAAFAAQVAASGPGTTLLVDTYDIPRGIATALEVAGPALGAIRIDSGDLGVEARRARAQLDAAGATATRIVVSGDLDEHRICSLRGAPIDAYGVGTSLVTGSGAPTAQLVYKLVARATTPGGPLEGVAKLSGGKATIGGAKVAGRRLHDGVAQAEVLRPDGEPLPPDARPLQVPLIRGGVPVVDDDLAAARARHVAAVAELPPAARELTGGTACIPTHHELPSVAAATADRAPEEQP